MHSLKARTYKSKTLIASLVIVAFAVPLAVSACQNAACLEKCDRESQGFQSCLQSCCDSVQSQNFFKNSDIFQSPFFSMMVKPNEASQKKKMMPSFRNLKTPKISLFNKDFKKQAKEYVEESDSEIPKFSLFDTQWINKVEKMIKTKEQLHSKLNLFSNPWITEASKVLLKGKKSDHLYETPSLQNQPIWINNLKSMFLKKVADKEIAASKINSFELPGLSLFKNVLATLPKQEVTGAPKVSSIKKLFSESPLPWISFFDRALDLPSVADSIQEPLAQVQPLKFFKREGLMSVPWMSFFDRDLETSPAERAVREHSLLGAKNLIKKSETEKSALPWISMFNLKPEQLEEEPALPTMKDSADFPWVSMFSKGLKHIASIQMTKDLSQDSQVIQVLADDNSVVLRQISRDHSDISLMSEALALINPKEKIQTMISNEDKMKDELQKDLKHKKLVLLREKVLSSFNSELEKSFNEQSSEFLQGFENFQMSRINERAIKESRNSKVATSNCDVDCGSDCFTASSSLAAQEECLQNTCHCSFNLFYGTNSYCSQSCASHCSLLEDKTRAQACVSQCGCDKDSEVISLAVAIPEETVEAGEIAEGPIPQNAVWKIAVLAGFAILIVFMMVYSCRRVKKLAQKGQLFKNREIKRERKEKMIESTSKEAQDIIDTFEIEASYERVA